MAMEPDRYLHLVCEQLAAEMTRVPAAKLLTNNSELYGSYVEGVVRKFIRRFVSPLQVSTGTILYEGNVEFDTPQLDAIIWHPSPLPPVLEVGDFAVVPRLAAVAYLEIKSSNYRGTHSKIEKCLSRVDELVPKTNLPSQWQDKERALGVICIYSEDSSSEKLDDLIEQGSVARLLWLKSKDSEPTIDSGGIARLAHFLNCARLRAKYLDGQFTMADPGQPCAR